MKYGGIYRWAGAVVLCSAAMVGVTSVSAHADGGAGRVFYSSLPLPTPANVPSEGPEAYAYNELGNEVTVGSHGERVLRHAILGLSSWACASGAWNTQNCVTPEGSTFSVPITLNIYNAPASGSYTPGSLIASVTQTFDIPYRPSQSSQCVGASAGEWYDPASQSCYHGLYTTVDFHFDGVKLPSTFVYGVSFDTTHYGPSPIGPSAPCFSTAQGCPYDSLNIALSQDPTNVSVGADTVPGTVFQNSPLGSEYCDGGAAGTGTFRLDSPNVPSCWGSYDSSNGLYDLAPYYVPAIQFQTNNAGQGDGGGHGHDGSSHGDGGRG